VSLGGLSILKRAAQRPDSITSVAVVTEMKPVSCPPPLEGENSTMRRTQIVALLVVLALAVARVPTFAADIVGMPVGNQPKAGNVEFNYIYWREPVPGLSHIGVAELYYGVTDQLEINALTFAPQGMGSKTELNFSYAVVPETAEKPSLIVGATNLNEVASRGLPGQPPLAKASPFVLSAYNVRVPQGGPPSLNNPLIRLHLGYGTEIHGDELFGGVQFLVDPHLGGAILNYQGQPAYMLTLIPQPGTPLEITAGTLQGEKFLRVGYIWAR